MRYGPLQMVDGGLAIAEVAERHVRMTPAGIALHVGGEQIASLAWREVGAVALVLPKTWVPFPRTMATFAYAIVTLVTQDVDTVEPRVAGATVTTRDGIVHDWPMTAAIGGYPRRAVTVAVRLVESFVDVPERRALLRHPDEIMRRYVSSARWRSPLV